MSSSLGGGTAGSSTARRCFPTALAAALATLTGCTQYHAAPLAPERSAEQLAARRLSDQQLGRAVRRLLPQVAASWPLAQWDRGELLAVALVSNPRLAIAQAQEQAAVARERTAGELPNPGLTLESEYRNEAQKTWEYGLYFDWLLPSPGRRRLARQIARIQTDNTHLQLMEEAWAVRRGLTAALSDWESARRRGALLEQLAAAQDRLAALEQQRVRAGEDAPGELVSVEGARMQIRQQLSESRMLAAAAQSAAAQALGMPPAALDGLALSWPDWGSPPPVDTAQRRRLQELALLSRPDLAALIGDYAIAERQLRLAIARQYPDITLEPGYYWDHGVVKWPANLGLTLPINGNRSEIATARGARDVAGKRMLALQADIYSQIAAAERAEALAREATAAAESQLQSAQRQLAQSRLSLSLGASAALEEVSAEILVVQAQLAVLQMRTQLQAARNELEDAMHLPLSGPELALAQWYANPRRGGS